ncbi:MAG TPA: histidinol-phosphatase [Bacillota bacterium]|nr:histidinol-phosphatase [Bacillota bacterium]
MRDTEGRPVMLADYHMHIENGELATEYVLLYKEAARRAGLYDFGVSEHLHNLSEGPRLLGRETPAGVKTRGWDTDSYISVIRSAGAKVAIEADYIPECENELRSFIVAHDFDYVIGSVHWLGPWVFDMSTDLWEGVDVTDAWRTYFRTAIRAVSTGMFEIFGHPDVIKVFGMKPPAGFYGELLGLYEDLAKAAALTGTCLEVSSAGLRKPCKEIYPDIELLRAANRAGADISFGSDAHYPEHVAFAFDTISEFARSAGFSRAAAFSERKKTLFQF